MAGSRTSSGTARPRRAAAESGPPAARPGVPDWVPPQLATVAAGAPRGREWVHEIKYDGVRILARVDGTAVRLFTRNRKDWTARYPGVAEALGRLGLSGAVLDGEVGVELEDGRTSFQALQNLAGTSAGAGARLRFWIFDVAFLGGADVRSRSLVSRKSMLKNALQHARDPLRYSDHIVGRGEAFLARACGHGLEGIISKRAAAPYSAGRGRDWLKVKCIREQEFVIGGFTEPGGSRKGLGALHVGTYEDDRLVYRGKVGTGFTDAVLRDLRRRLRPLVRSAAPFADGPRGAAARGSQWVEPRLVAQLRFTELTGDGRLRHPVFRGLREDKPPDDVHLETLNASHERRGSKVLKSNTMAKTRERATKPPVGRRTAEVAGVRLTNADKLLYPDAGVTKHELASYYEAVAEWMLPHVSGRPLTLVRCPAGQQGPCFFQKHFDGSVPAAVRRIRIEERDGPEWYGTLDSAAGLVSLVQLGTLEVHAWGSRSDRLERPDRLVIDLDPDPGVTWDAVVDGALHVHDLLGELGLVSFLKTTGGKGLHVVAPLVRRADWSDVKRFAQAVAELLAQAAPERYTTAFSKRKRQGRILVDYLRNARGATAIEAYSTRAHPGAPVAAPIHWDELADGVRANSFTVRNMGPRMRELGEDPWKDFGAVKQSLTAPMMRRLGL
jgi:bifunctional non-homologous end joining protein LigD